MKISIGVIDYGLGNQASVVHSLRDLGFSVRVSSQPEVLNQLDVLLLPGVGAFAPAMRALRERGLVEYLREVATSGRPMIGICLGMQLLTDASYENEYTQGLGLIPGEIVPFESGVSHIGWNIIENVSPDKGWIETNGETFYFNHTYHYQGSDSYKVCTSKFHVDFAAIINKQNILGIQFHPEKSQLSGRRLLKKIVEEFARA